MADALLAITTPAVTAAAPPIAAPIAAGVEQLFASMMADLSPPAADAPAPVASNDIAPAMAAMLQQTPPKIAVADEDDAPEMLQHDSEEPELDEPKAKPAVKIDETIAPTLAALMAVPAQSEPVQAQPVQQNTRAPADAAPAPIATKVAATPQQIVQQSTEQAPPPAVAQAIAALIAGKSEAQPAAAETQDNAPADPVAKADAPAPTKAKPTLADNRVDQPRADRRAAPDPAQQSPEIARPVRDTKRTNIAELLGVTNPHSTPRAAAAAATAQPLDAQSSADASLTRTLAVAHDGQWLDSLAREISSAATDSTLRFRLSPEHLGNMTVQIERHDDGAAVHLAADRAETRQMLTDAQPRLEAEARAQGLALRETTVSASPATAQSHNHNNGGGNGAATTDHGRSQGQTPRQPANQNHAPSRLAVEVLPASTSDLYA